MRRMLIAGNWKMNTTRSTGVALAQAIAEQAADATNTVDVLICPPFPYLISVSEAVASSAVTVGAQDVYFEPPGAFTGEVSLEMLKDIGCPSVILGHSERRNVLGECNGTVNKKVLATLNAGLQVILCVGELITDREAARTESVLNEQMDGSLAGVSAEGMANVVIAYEPVWAIGTGLTASPEQADSAHAHLRKWLTERYSAEVADKTQILYGGSVKPENAASLLTQPHVDGALVGGASLKPELFVPIIQAAVAASA